MAAVTLDLINAFISVSPVALKFNMSIFCWKSTRVLVNVFTKSLFCEIFDGNKSEPLIAVTSFFMLSLTTDHLLTIMVLTWTSQKIHLTGIESF